MEGEGLGRVVAVTLPVLLTPLACAAFGMGTPAASGLPSLSGGAPPAAQPDDGEEAPAGPCAIPAGQQARQQANNAEPRDIGRGLADDLTMLDDASGALATRLEPRLPGQANEEQQSWLAQPTRSAR